MDKLLEKRTFLVGGEQKPPTPSADQGARGTKATGQLSREDLKTMTPAQIVEARKEGKLDNLLGA
jgi:hypothetical protein